ncbi:MAG: hypothetical protein JW723_06115 [Bacteroidales bacterium]|nr:hypothetical protein [Bacteroidales bacterium]
MLNGVSLSIGTLTETDWETRSQSRRPGTFGFNYKFQYGGKYLGAVAGLHLGQFYFGEELSFSIGIQDKEEVYFIFPQLELRIGPPKYF